MDPPPGGDSVIRDFVTALRERHQAPVERKPKAQSTEQKDSEDTSRVQYYQPVGRNDHAITKRGSLALMLLHSDGPFARICMRCFLFHT